MSEVLGLCGAADETFQTFETIMKLEQAVWPIIRPKQKDTDADAGSKNR